MLLHRLDNAARIGMALGIALILQPWWARGLQVGFFVTAVTTLLYIVTSHLILPEEP